MRAYQEARRVFISCLGVTAYEPVVFGPLHTSGGWPGATPCFPRFSSPFGPPGLRVAPLKRGSRYRMAPSVASSRIDTLCGAPRTRPTAHLVMPSITHGFLLPSGPVAVQAFEPAWTSCRSLGGHACAVGHPPRNTPARPTWRQPWP